MGGARGCRNVAATPGRHEPRPNAHAHSHRGGTDAAGAHAQARPGGRRSRGAANHRACRRAAAPRVRRAGETIEPMIALLLLVLQSDGWVVSPNQPTVGDTIRIERTITAPPGWRMRAGKLPSGSLTEPLTDATVLATSTPGRWVVRYAIVAWEPGPMTRSEEHTSELQSLRHLVCR